MHQAHIGTSGWSYRHWRDCFYRDVKQKDRLVFYTRHFSTVEINGSFYRLQQRGTLEKWYDLTPAHFRFALKANRYLTHNRKLRDPERSVLIEKDHASYLKEKLAVVLWQLPQSLAQDLPRLSDFIEALSRWADVRHTIEFRHPSWFADDTAEYLSKAGIAACFSDAGDWPRWDRVTTDLVYLRLHGRPRTYASRYTPEALRRWAALIGSWLSQQKQVYVYFDNDAECAAPDNARELQALLSGKC